MPSKGQADLGGEGDDRQGVQGIVRAGNVGLRHPAFAVLQNGEMRPEILASSPVMR